jgi:ADP-dependent NAD(P)H-hydrate dehydratase / NAD(P)H-hydrate epimerase
MARTAARPCAIRPATAGVAPGGAARGSEAGSRYPRGAMPRPAPDPTDRSTSAPLPADDPALLTLDLDQLEARWADAAGRLPMNSEQMSGADLRAQRLGVPGRVLMEHAGTAAAAVAAALIRAGTRDADAPVLVLAGPGNNGGDGSVVARRLARDGRRVIVALVSVGERPGTPDAAANWDRLAHEELVTLVHCPAPRDIKVLEPGIERAALVVDALLGTGVSGPLREPVRAAVLLARAARRAGVPILAIDTPTAVDLTSGDPSDPVVRATATITFHRPKAGLRTRSGSAFAGRVLVAPIGIPPDADRG